MFSFLRRTSAQQLASAIVDYTGNDDADAAEVEDLLRVRARANDRLRAKRTRSVTFEFEIEIKTEDEDDSSLSAGLSGNDQDSGDSDWPTTPRHQLVVEVPKLSPEEKQAYTSTTAQHDEDSDGVSPLKMGTRRTRPQRARNARPSTTVSPDKSKAVPAKARAARKPAVRRKVKVEEEEKSRSTKRRKLNSGSSSSSDIEEIPPPPRVTRSRKSVAQTTVINGKVPIVAPQVDEIVVASARATRRHAAVAIKEEPTDEVVPLRRSPRKRARGQ